MPIVNAAVARQVSPDVFTAAGVVAAGAAGVAVALGCWPLAALFMVLRLAGANLDGAVARARGVSRPWGFVVNEIGDRTADLLAFAGLAVWAARQNGPGLNWLSWPVLQVLVAALAATLPDVRIAGRGRRRRDAPQRRPARQDRTVPVRGAGHRVSGHHAGAADAVGERFADHHRAAAAGRASRGDDAAEGQEEQQPTAAGLADHETAAPWWRWRHDRQSDLRACCGTGSGGWCAPRRVG